MIDHIVDIILVEDNLDDARLTMRALKKKNLANNLLHMRDGVEIMEYLKENRDSHLPKIILLDIKMPKVDGLEVLQFIKSDEKLKAIPVVLLTSSKEQKDIIKSYQLGANAYIVKPVDFENFLEAVNEIGMFWLVLNQLPE